MDPHGILHSLYYDPKQPSSYGTLRTLYQSAKTIYPSIKLRDVRAWLLKQDIYSMHGTLRKKFKRRKTLSKGLYYQMQMDLIDMSKYKRNNSNYTFILTAIDIFSRKAFAEPLKSKHARVVRDAIDKIFSDYPKVKYLQTDLGNEFYGKEVKQYLKDKNVIHFSTSSDTKCAIVERFNRTLKARIFRYMAAKKTTKYVDVLHDFVTSYNNKVHRSIGIAPNKVTESNESAIWNYQYKDYIQAYSGARFKFRPGDTVRISMTENPFKKGYLKRYNEEYFTVHYRIATDPPTYKLIDQKGEVLIGSFYEPEIHPVTPVDGRYTALRKRTRKGVKEILVHYVGRPADQQEWIPERILNRQSREQPLMQG